MKTKAVFDMDSGPEPRVIEKFDPLDTDRVIEKYKNDSRWDDVGVDQGGDIILWEEE